MSGIQVTPLVINGTMYVTAGKDVIALEPETAKVVWRYTAPAAVSRRGVAYWPGDRDTPPRLFSGAGDRLMAVDAERGKPATGFGEGGSVDLKASIRGDVDGGFSLASPPTIYKNIVITGGNNGEQSPSLGLYGDIRGWDATPASCCGRSTRCRARVNRAWRRGKATAGRIAPARTSGRSSPSTPSAASSTRRSARRHRITTAAIGRGAICTATRVVALDATTGRLKWHRQLVHHDIWDYDVPAAPTLIDVKRNGQLIPAVAVMTKMSLLFIFDRVTGEPIFGMEERPVPQAPFRASGRRRRSRSR